MKFTTDEWNKNNFSIYDSEEKTVLKLLDKWGKYLGYAIDKVDDLPKEVQEQLITMYNNGILTELISNVGAEVVNDVNNSLQKDIINFSEFGKDIEDMNERFETVVKYSCDNNLKLYIDQDIELTRPVTLYNNTHIISNRFKYKIFTKVGVSLNAINLIECYNLKNVVVDNVKFENTGYGSSGSNGINGLFDGFGAGLCFGNCSNIEVKNCEFFKCGGYDFGEGSAMLWYSCCHYAIARNNYFHLGDNAITVDRWYASAPANSNTFNYGIIIEGNLIEHVSGRGICVENINDKGNIIITNNLITDFGIAGIEGRSFTDTIITNNIFNGDLSVRVNPKEYYNLSEVGWNWAEKILVAPKYGIQLISGGDRQLISNNIIKNVSSQGITLGDMTSCVITGNRIENCTNHAIYGKPVTANSNSFVCTGNSMRDCGMGVKLTTGSDDIKCTKVVISNNNIKVTSESVSLENCTHTTVTDNTIIVDTGTYGIYINKSNWIKLNNMLICETTGTKVTNGIYIANTSNVILDGVISNFTTLLTGVSITDLRGNCIFKNGTNAMSIDTTVTGDGRNFKFNNISANIKTKGNNFPITLYLDSQPTSALGQFSIGDLVYYNNPITTGYLMSVCKAPGSGGTWTNLIPVS